MDIAKKMETLYDGNVDNVDAFVGGLAEPHVEGGAVGELFATIIADQFARLRNGDRHWFENNDALGDEILRIKSTKMAQVVARNSGIDAHDISWSDSKEGGKQREAANLADVSAFFVPAHRPTLAHATEL